MKWRYCLFLSIYPATFLLINSGCNADLCKDINCGDNGTCFEGNCNCNIGYSGNLCQHTWSGLYTGTYKGTRACTSASGNHFLEVESDITAPGPMTLAISNFAGYGATAEFTLQVENAHTYVFSEFEGSEGTYYISGSWVFYGDTLSLAYQVTQTGIPGTQQCVLAYVRQ